MGESKTEAHLRKLLRPGKGLQKRGGGLKSLILDVHHCLSGLSDSQQGGITLKQNKAFSKERNLTTIIFPTYEGEGV